MKISANVERDRRAEVSLHEAGWKVIVVWQCEIDRDHLERLHQEVLGEVMLPETGR